MYIRIWRFVVRPEFLEEFEGTYGSDGGWASLFRRSSGYRGTELLHSDKNPFEYITIDRWNDIRAWNLFLETMRDEYLALDRKCGVFSDEEKEVGTFTIS